LYLGGGHRNLNVKHEILDEERNQMGKRVLLVFVIATLVIVLVGSQTVAIGQNDPVITIDLVEYDSNPVLPAGEPGDWDELIFSTTVIYHDGMFHMLYWGISGDFAGPIRTGYATSADGLTWTKFEGNPIHVYADDQGRVGGACGAAVEDDYWVIYLCVAEEFGDSVTLVMRATAPDPTAEWTIDPTPVMEAGGMFEWDHNGMWPRSLVKTSDEYVAYYVGDGSGIGRITSPDGIIWTKYNDPDTTDNLYATSDPIMEKGLGEAWDALWVEVPLVRQRDEGWEMFYLGGRTQVSGGMGYATSPDGINWTRFENNPVVQPLRVPSSFVVVDDVYYIYYRDHEAWDVRVMTGTVTWR
jgi:hypothetical protein